MGPDQRIGQLLEPRAEDEVVERPCLRQRRVDALGAEALERVSTSGSPVKWVERSSELGDLAWAEHVLTDGVPDSIEVGEQRRDVHVVLEAAVMSGGNRQAPMVTDGNDGG